MITIPLISQKGGSGKTTLATNLAVVASHAGYIVGLLDTDARQSSATEWYDDRPEGHLSVQVLPIHPSRLEKEIETARNAGLEILFIDTAGFIDKPTYDAASAADLVIVPVQPTVLDVRSLRGLVPILQQHASRYLAVLTRTSARGTEEDSAAQTIGELGIPVAVSRIGDRVGFKRSFSYGLGVIEDVPKERAADEIRALWQEICALLDIKKEV